MQVRCSCVKWWNTYRYFLPLLYIYPKFIQWIWHSLYPPTKPNDWFNKQLNKNNKKTASDCYRSKSHILDFQWIMTWIDSLKLLRKKISMPWRFQWGQNRKEKGKSCFHMRGRKKHKVPGYLYLHKTKSKLLFGEKLYIHLAVTVQAVAIPLKNKSTLFFPTKQKPPRCYIIYRLSRTLCHL